MRTPNAIHLIPATLVVALPLMASCTADGPSTLQVERDTIGDTIVVRTVAGSVWDGPAALVPEVRIGVFEGEDHYMFGNVRSLAVAPDGSIYVVDSQVPALRKYNADGQFEATFGREGEGPGEYRGPDAGLAVLPDGRVVLRDPRNARLQVYSATGEPLATWPIRGNFHSSNPLVVDTAGRVYTQILLDPEASVMDWKTGLLAIDSGSGEPVDTVAAPEWDFDAPRIIAQHVSEDGTSTSVNSVPFAPDEHWAFSPVGYMVGGVSDRYAVDLYRRDGPVLRIERAYDPVPVAGGERSDQEAQARWSMRRTQPDWTWNGPAIPDEKPPFRDLLVGKDGRIWVLLHTPGERIPEDEAADGADDGPNPRPVRRWRTPPAFDVFERDGTYLGRVEAPAELSLSPRPVMDGDRVWAVVRDALDVQYVVRYRLSRDPSPAAME